MVRLAELPGSESSMRSTRYKPLLQGFPAATRCLGARKGNGGAREERGPYMATAERERSIKIMLLRENQKVSAIRQQRESSELSKGGRPMRH